MSRKRKILAADLFCGAGGTSTGLLQAAELLGRKVELTAVNHWERAVETHAANHPRANHICQDLTRVRPAEVVPGGRLDLLVASPECTHHSTARGGKPKNDQSRASAWIVLEWVNALRVDRVLIENVPEFVSWGPIGADGRALKSQRGKTFVAFIDALKSSGYRVEWKVLNSANYGAAQCRRRLFIQAARGRLPIRWPSPTNDRDPSPGLFGQLPKWRAAREVIDWSLVGGSIFTRKRPLSENTLARIEAGLRKFCGGVAEPFIVAMNYMRERGHDWRRVQSVDKPLQTVTATGNRFGLVQPFLVPANYGERNGQSPRTHDVNEPLPTIVGGGSHAIVEPFLLHTTHHGADRINSIGGPLPTVTGANRGEQALVQPFILPHRQFEQMDVDSIDSPLRTITATNGQMNALVEPFITPFYGTSLAASIREPMPTVTCKDRFGLVEPRSGQVGIDIGFRMLQPHELKAGMGFPSDYKITGNRSEQVRQIGNAVEVNQARELCAAALKESR